jgi:outer membrane protein assembly factor BamB
MTDETQANDHPVSNTSTEFSGPRMWPAIVILVFIAAAIGFGVQASSLLQNATGYFIGPAVGLILMSIWWLLSRGVPVRDRILGLVTFLAAVGLIVAAHGPQGMYMSAFVLPAMLAGVVAMLIITARMPWQNRRNAGLLAILACVAIFLALRIDNVGGDLLPNLSWRWQAPAQATWEDGITNPGKTAALPDAVGPSDWPAFRGPDRDSRAAGVTFNTDWQTNPPKEIWRQPIGLGFSSFAVVGDYIFTQEQRDEWELVICYDGRTGETVWLNQIETRFSDPTGDGPRATPTYLDGKLYAQSATGALQCLDAATGEVLWKRDLKEDTGASVPQWGFASSPLIVNDLVIVFAGGPHEKGAVAYNVADGSMAWCGGKGVHGYSSAHLAHFADTDQVIITSDFGVQSLTPDKGKVLWEHEWEIRMNPRCVQPIIPGDDAILIGTAGGQGTRRIDIAKTGEGWTVDQQWTTKRYKPYFNDSIYFDGHCYGFDGDRLVCIDTATGDTVWKGDRCGGQVLFLPDMKMLLVLTEAGEVMLVEAAPDDVNVVAQFQALEGKTWNHPVIAHGKLFVRNSAEMACFELPK